MICYYARRLTGPSARSGSWACRIDSRPWACRRAYPATTFDRLTSGAAGTGGASRQGAQSCPDLSLPGSPAKRHKASMRVPSFSTGCRSIHTRVGKQLDVFFVAAHLGSGPFGAVDITWPWIMRVSLWMGSIWPA